MASHVAHLLSLLFTLAAYYFMDMGSDLKLAYELYKNGYLVGCLATLGVNVLAIYFINALGIYWESRDYGLTWRSCLFFVLPYGLLYQRIRCLALLLPIVFYEGFNIGNMDIEHLLMREDWKAVILALIQTLSANMIHMVWHLHLIITEAEKFSGWEFSIVSSVVISVVSCSLALGDYHNGRRNILSYLKHNYKIRTSAYIFTYLATFCMLTSRFAAMILSLSNWMRYVLIAIIAIHWIISLVVVLKWDFDLFHEVKIKQVDTKGLPVENTLRVFTSKKCVEFGAVLLSILLLVSHVEIEHKEKIIFVYFFENLALLLGWYFTYDKEDQWHLWVLVSIIVINLVGISLNFLIWTKFVKKSKEFELSVKNEENSEENSESKRNSIRSTAV